MEKSTKIEAAILDTKLRVDSKRQDLMLLNREMQVLNEQIEMLEIIKDSKDFL